MIIMHRWYLSCTWTCDSHSGPKAADHSINNVHTGGSFTLIQHMLMNYNVLSYLSQLLPFLMLQRNLSLNNELLTCAEAGGGGCVYCMSTDSWQHGLTLRTDTHQLHWPSEDDDRHTCYGTDLGGLLRACRSYKTHTFAIFRSWPMLNLSNEIIIHNSNPWEVIHSRNYSMHLSLKTP